MYPNAPMIARANPLPCREKFNKLFHLSEQLPPQVRSSVEPYREDEKMSHQTGIKANEGLREFFGKCRDGSIRLIKVNIVDEQLSLSEYCQPKSKSWEKDYGMIRPLLIEDEPCYILFRLDSKDAAGYNWLLFTWSPENSQIRHKMVYASTKSTLRMEFGAAQIKEEVFATTLVEATWEGYLHNKRNKDAPAPLTLAEEERAELRKGESGAGISVDSKHETLKGVLFPITEEAMGALIRFRDRKLSYVQLKLSLEEERIELGRTSATGGDADGVEGLSKRVTSSGASYHLFWFPHTHQGDFINSSIFIYSMPGYNCSIKERMLYSSCKGPLLEALERELGLSLDKRIEMEAGDEVITEKWLVEELHPTTNLSRPKFAKPKGPQVRGAKRITKVGEGAGDAD